MNTERPSLPETIENKEFYSKISLFGNEHFDSAEFRFRFYQHLVDFSVNLPSFCTAKTVLQIPKMKPVIFDPISQMGFDHANFVC
jgi:hypothetical protein